MDWFIKYRPQLIENVSSLTKPGDGGRLLLSIVNQGELARVIQRMLDPEEFLSDHGLRSLSKHHVDHPFTWHLDGQDYTVSYEPAESSSWLFGGNSNWRGPIWFPINYLMLGALRKYHEYYGDSFSIEMPNGSGKQLSLKQASDDLGRRLTSIFLRDDARGGRRPVYGDDEIYRSDPHWRDLILFYEYFHGDSAVGLGASHQTGWTALVARLIQECGGETKA